MMLDVIIVGGGPAGLSAALMLGRCRRSVLLCDAGRPRNGAARALHGYLTRDGIDPHELLRIGREELHRYDVDIRDVAVTEASCAGDEFEVTLATGERTASSALLVATGVRDHVPDIPGVEECYGISAHHCPYCDGWENRDKALVVIGHRASGAALALSLKTWSSRVSLCSNGRARLAASHRSQLEAQKIEVNETPIDRLEHAAGQVQRIVLVSGERLACDAVFFPVEQSPQSDIPLQFGCALTSGGVVKTDHLGHTHIPGLYVVGDASRDVQFAIVAAAEGAKAAVAINKALQARKGLTAEPAATPA
jgi:thioredoxin reductase